MKPRANFTPEWENSSAPILPLSPAIVEVGKFVFPVFIQNKSLATDDEIKIAACLFPDF